MDVRVFQIMPVHRQLQFPLAEPAQVFQKLQLPLQCRRCLGVGQQLVNRALMSEELVLAFDRLSVKTQGLAARNGQHYCQQREPQQTLSSAACRF